MKKILFVLVLMFVSIIANGMTDSYLFADWNKTFNYTYFSDDPEGVINNTAKYAKTNNGIITFDFKYKHDGIGNITITFTFDNYKLSSTYTDVIVIYDIDTNSVGVIDVETKNYITYFVNTKKLLIIEYLGDFKKNIIIN